MMTSPSLQYKLRPYQREDCEFLKARPFAGCFNEQRTGKTPTAIVSIAERGFEKTVVVCPKSATYAWATEWSHWGKGPAVALRGPTKQKQRALENWNSGALIISYGALKSTKSYEGLLSAILKKNPNAVIVDEAHRIKDRNSANAKAVFRLGAKAECRIALTGTPASNKPEELWSILHFLFPQTFKSFWAFVNEYCNTVHVRMGARQFIQITGIRADKKVMLSRMLCGIATQRKRKDIMQWLPAKEYVKVMLDPSNEQKRYLSELQDYFETEHVVTKGVLDRLIRYRQICLAPEILGLKGKSPKTNWILEYLGDYPERPTIIFSKFTSYLHILHNVLGVYKPMLIIGDKSAKQRQEAVDSFQSGKCNLLLINIDAGKEALTLDRAEAIIFTDKFPPVGDILQAEDRFVATTKEKADKAHVIYELIIKGTYDEQIYNLIDKRFATVDVINDFKNYMKGEC